MRRITAGSWRMITKSGQVDWRAVQVAGGGQLRVISFITEQKVIHKILTHPEKRNSDSRPPPEP